jgi:hypothetical protein
MTMERENLRQYLLGRLPEESADELDERLFAKDDLHRELQLEQDALAEDFLEGRLADADAASFRAQMERSPLLQEKVHSLRVLLLALDKPPIDVSDRTAFRFSQFPILLSAALALMLCVVAFLFVRESHRNAELTLQLLALPAAPRPLVGSIGSSPVAVVFLSANVSRAPSAPPEIAIPATASLIELQVELHEPLPYDGSWDAEVLRGNELIWKSNHLRVRRLGKEAYLALFLDPAALQAGSYVVRYMPSENSGSAQIRPFRVSMGA